MRDTQSQPLTGEPVGCCLCKGEELRPLVHVLARGLIKCRGCGLIYLYPRPTPTDLVQRYAGDRTDLAQEEQLGELRNYHFSRLLKHAGVPGRLLDIGCGFGFFLKLAREAGWDAIGVDLNPRAIDYAKERLRVNALLGDPRDLHFPDRSFDLVTLWNVLDHALDPVDLLSEVRRVLRDDGYVFIRTPNVLWQYPNFRLVNFLRPLGWGKLIGRRPFTTFIFHLTNFSPFTLRLVLDRSGFVLLRIKNSPPIPGDPYLGLGPVGKRLVSLAKLGIYGIAQGVAMASGGRLFIGPSLEAWGKRGQIARVRA